MYLPGNSCRGTWFCCWNDSSPFFTKKYGERPWLDTHLDRGSRERKNAPDDFPPASSPWSCLQSYGHRYSTIIHSSFLPGIHPVTTLLPQVCGVLGGAGG